jgi:hypothetical protein
MAANAVTEQDLRRELSEFHDRYPKLRDDDLFVLWFLRAFVTEDEHDALKALCGGPGDKSLDAVFVDDHTRNVFFVQGKNRQGVGLKAEDRTEVEAFAQLAPAVCGDASAFRSLMTDLAPEVAKRLVEARERLKRGYRPQFHYVTTGRCSEAVRASASRIVRACEAAPSFEVIDGRRVLLLLSDYLDGVAPPVPSLDLEIESGGNIKPGGVLQRLDLRTDIESWVFSISDETVAQLYESAGTRLFARNVRGFLGSTEINRGMGETLADEPEYFWYYNNGITIICDAAQHISSGGRDILRVANPQVINGQQTTRVLSESFARTPRASVLVRVIRVPRDGAAAKPRAFENLVSKIVAATNWQNEIRPSDLMSNDRMQIDIDRQLRKLGYFYLRKRQKKGEARRAVGSHHFHILKKEEVAQAVAATEFDPAVVREGKERLFEERWYSRVFQTAAPEFYLNRYWLLRQVSYVARGYPERAYAKWLVLHFVWPYLAPVVRSADSRSRFWAECLSNSAALTPLCQAVALTFTVALAFFRKKRGQGAKAQDISTFFQRKGLDKEFDKFWKSPANRSKRSFKRAWARFEKGLSAR